MGKAARQECPEGQGRALDEEERRELLRLQEPPRRGQGAQADPQMGCNPRGRARQSEARRSARSLQHRQRGMGGQRLPLGPDRGEPEGEGLAGPYPPARCTQSSAVRAPEVGEHGALEGARPCRARIRPAAELDGRQDCAHHWHRPGEVKDWHDEPRLQHPPAGSARADGSCTRLSALTGGVRVASCKGPRGCRLGVKTVPDRGLTSAQALQPLAQLRQKSPKASIVRGSLKPRRWILTRAKRQTSFCFWRTAAIPRWPTTTARASRCLRISPSDSPAYEPATATVSYLLRSPSVQSLGSAQREQYPTYQARACNLDG